MLLLLDELDTTDLRAVTAGVLDAFAFREYVLDVVLDPKIDQRNQAVACH